MAVKAFDPKKVVMVFAGAPISGFAEGTFMSIEYNADLFTLAIGSDGEGTRIRTNNNSGRVTVTLMQSSDSNDVLSGLYTLDAATKGAGGTGGLLIKDTSGNTVCAAEVAWIVKMPVVKFANTGTNRVWVFETDNLAMFAGGNTSIGSAADETPNTVNFSGV